MAFSLIGRCPRTGEIGAASTASTIAFGSRTIFVAHGVGAVVTQSRTDPRLGPRGLDLLRSGCSVGETVDALVASTPQRRWRQLGVLDLAGNSAAYSGASTLSEMAQIAQQDVCAIGNALATSNVPAAMIEAFMADTTAPLAERLVRALEAGLAAGGNLRPGGSAGMRVIGAHSFPTVDLRIDWDEAPIPALRRLWERYAPVSQDLIQRALDPDSAYHL